MYFNKEIRSPMSETKKEYIIEEDRDLVRKYAFDPAFGGKWILFFGISYMDKMWARSCKLYRKGQFTGIKSIKCSTAKHNPKQGSSTRQGVIIFHCGPYSDTANIHNYGRNIVEKMKYFSKTGHIPYKTDVQTARGTRATGITINSMYRIPVPKTQFDISAREEDSSKLLQRNKSEDKARTRSLVDQALQLQEEMHVASGGKVAFQLVLDQTHPVYTPSSPTGQTNPSRIMEFKIRDVLGSGGYAIVFQAYLEIDDHEYALKRIPLPTKKERQDRVLREVRVLAKLNHPNVVRYYACWQETHTGDWVGHFDDPWKQKLRDRCLTESFRTPVADTTTCTSSFADSSIHEPGGLPHELNETICDLNAITLDSRHAESHYESDSDEDLVVGKEYNAQYAGVPKATKNIRGINTKIYDTNSCSSNIQFQKEEPYTKTKKAERTRSNTDYLYIQMELCRRRSLKEWLAENTERPKQTVLKYFLDIVNAVEHVHDKRMMHRDLKPSNIFFDLENESLVKVGDFGLGTHITEDCVEASSSNLCVPASALTPGYDQHTQNVGTFSYMSPEQRGRGRRPYTYKVDIFPMGLILFEMLWVMKTAQEKIRTLEDARKMVFPAGFADEYPNELLLLHKMLHKDPNQRPTTRGIRAQPLLRSMQLAQCVDSIKPEEHYELVSKMDEPVEDP